MNESFSRAVTAFVSFHRVPSRSTESLIRFRYFSSCSSGGGNLLRHSSTTLSFALIPEDFIFSRCRRTFSVCAVNVFCHFSSRCGRARLSSKSKTVIRSRGGNNSQSSWYELLFENEGFRDMKPGVGGNESEGVLTPGGVKAPTESDDLLESLLGSSGERVGSTREAVVGISMGSDILRA